MGCIEIVKACDAAGQGRADSQLLPKQGMVPKSCKPACARLPLADHVQEQMQVQARLTESSVFQVRKSQLRAYLVRDLLSEQ